MVDYNEETHSCFDCRFLEVGIDYFKCWASNAPQDIKLSMESGCDSWEGEF